MKRTDLCTVEEVDSEKTDGIEEIKDEKEGSRNVLCAWRLDMCHANCDDAHRETHASTGQHHQVTSTPSLDGEECDSGRQCLESKNGCSEHTSCDSTETDNVEEQGGDVVRDEGRSRHLLEELGHDSEACPPAVHLWAHLEQVEVRPLLSEACCNLHLLNQDPSSLETFLRVLSKDLERSLRILNAVLSSQPSRTLGEHEYGAGDGNEHEDRNSDW